MGQVPGVGRARVVRPDSHRAAIKLGDCCACTQILH